MPIQTVIYLLVGLFALLLLLPIVLSIIYYYTNKGEILHINQNRVKDPRYFGKSFAAMVESRLEDAVGDTIKLSREEKFINCDKENIYKQAVEQLVIGREREFICPDNIKEFQKEIYCKENIIFNAGEKEIRAAYSQKNIIVGNDITVGRWIDALGTVAIYDNCDLGISVTSKSRMSIGENCRFRRLYAPEICIGQYPDDIKDPIKYMDERIYKLPVQTSKKRNVKYINTEMINEEGIANFSVLSWKNILVTENIVVQGDVRSHKGVRLFENAIVCGNIFAEEDIIIGKNACVLGNVFSQGSVVLEQGAVVGRRERICSIISRKDITFNGNNFVYGYVVCERDGLIAPKLIEDNSYIEQNNLSENDHGERIGVSSENPIDTIESLKFLDSEPTIKEIHFKDLAEFSEIDKQGFRFNKSLEVVTIPNGVEQIHKSMFFHCSKLQRVTLPLSIKKIQDYAFADCELLSDIQGIKESLLKGIRTSAFENCKGIKSIVIPKTVIYIGGAAFKGCTGLKTVEFSADASIKWLDDHSFCNCSSLTEIHIPQTVVGIGVSAFKGCSSLKEIHIPLHCKDCAGVLECDPDIIKVYDTENIEDKLIQQEGDTVSEVV